MALFGLLSFCCFDGKDKERILGGRKEGGGELVSYRSNGGYLVS